MRATLYSDGGSRGNPGAAALGYVLTLEDDREIKHGEYIGETTNNQAEYAAIIAGLAKAVELGVTQLDCYLDSELVVRQINGDYKVKNGDLRPRFAEVVQTKQKFEKITFTHIPREKNNEADSLVNDALDNISTKRNSRETT